MLLVLSLIVAALAAMVVAVAALRRPLICCPAAGVAAGILLVIAGRLALGEYYAYSVAALASGVVAGGWGLAMALDYADRRKAEEQRAADLARFPGIADYRPDLDGHTITVERVDRVTAREWIYVASDWESLIGRRAVVERHDGRLSKVCAIEGVDGVRSVFVAARATASTYGARYVPAGGGSSSDVRDELALENAAGGAR
ncbi:hypothetical protein ACIBI3_02160 [Actinomadura luteofluorescens]|uniref:hypothetical protein n=1 Tax=Actinomadura luteofluorescens TaxID=46163 RepID=UPI00347AB6C3